MNVLTVVVLIIFLLCMMIGYKHGLFRTIIKLVFTGLSLLLSYFLAPAVSNMIITHTSIDDYFNQKIYNVIENTVRENVEQTLDNSLSISDERAVDELTSIAMNTDPSKSYQIDIINEMDVPDFIKTALLDNNHGQARIDFGVNTFYEYVSVYVSYMIVNALAFTVTFVLIMLLFGIINLVLALAVRLPIVNGINRFGGLLFGVLEALLIVWILFVAIAIFSDTQVGVWAYRQIENSKILTLIYDKNIFMNVITDLSKIL
ncbi:MAG: CvpA family protein [Clostridium sp.]|nr:CvpA family protein [Clostridium sp.]MCM1399617.1 CvpA family protein [Clostridium sp.]MCM1460477.1 CvpA family protein [Bacteroides sp.]